MSKMVALKLGGGYDFNDTFKNISAVRFIGGGNKSTWRKSPTCRKSLTNFIT